mmetsp:Transcript_14066/g.32428  ORF Transcript_14066/g.32428 Transcript_14066/m.32428 type:complete len:799 (-) Transcript_14066:91-2487(-)
MAEAAAGARLDAALLSVRGDVALVATEDGTYSLTISFNPYRFRKHIKRTIFRIRRVIQNTIWPLTPTIWGGVTTAVVVRVVTAQSGSWWRSGSLANILWKWDNLFPWQQKLPTQVRVGWLSLLAGTVGLASISFVQRSLLRLLLNYKGWMFLDHGTKPSPLTKMWFLAVRALSGTQPSLYTYQGCLPSLPVPCLKETTRNFMLSVKPLLSNEEYNEMEEKMQKFMKNEGWKLQLFLQVRAMFTVSWLWEWWEKYVYLRGRSPIMVNSNYYILDGVAFTPTHLQAARAAALLHAADKFKFLIDWEKLDPIKLQKTIPWCMKQYERVFDTTRVPGKECDHIIHYDHDPQRYCAVSRKGVWYKLPMQVKGTNGKWRTALPHELEKQMSWIIMDSDANPAPEGQNAIAALTGWHRGRWAEAREEFFWDGINKISLETVEKAFMHIHLEDRSPSDLTNQAKMLIHGDGKSLWFDKSVTFIIFPNGKSGMMAEHSYADALTVGHMWEWVTTEERYKGGLYRDDGHCKGFDDSKYEQVELIKPQRLQWRVEAQLHKVINEAFLANKQLCDDLDLVVMTQDTWGKGFIKKKHISPDAFFQLAMQLAYRRDAGKRALTYEASVTRLFAQGRTETVRSLSIESAEFVDSMLDDSCPNAERVKKLMLAADKHTQLYKSAMVGKGVDRHLFGLYVASVGLGYDSDFLKAALKMPWTLSTSQTPQKQTEGRWNPEREDRHTVSAGGGFGPVADDGYGVSYMFPHDDAIYANISSKTSSSATSSARFRDNILRALADMKKILSDGDDKAKSK